jgi:mannose/cellobiose epimerase-like protein (N-acyl-D-glucosamine 2-epimerase family)
MTVPGDREYLAGERDRLLSFVPGSRHPLGFGRMDDHGELDPAWPVELWITCRMTHCASLGVRLGGSGNAELAAHGVASLAGPLRDAEHGGWFASVGDDGPVDPTKAAYGHAFVVLAASSAVAAGITGAPELLTAALDVSGGRFWDEDAGLSVEEWDRSWTTLEPYRGVNANMHTVEAYLAAGDVAGEPVWHQRAGRISAHVVDWAAGNGWRIPEHFDPAWTPLPDFHRDQPAHPFRPYGATIGHGLEWARLLLSVEATLGGAAPVPAVPLGEAAAALYDRALADGWAADGADGFVYTTDWDGTPVVRQRMHWVVAEGINTAACLHAVTGEQRYLDDYHRFWAYAETCLVDRDLGSWHHELDPANQVAATVWPGKPDVYHALQATLVPVLPLAPSMATALTPEQVAVL